MEYETRGLETSMFNVWKHRLDTAAKTLWNSIRYDKRRKMQSVSSGMTVMTIRCGSCGHLLNFNAQDVGIF